MTKTIVVMRHGKAKQADGGQQDIERELTDAGARALASTLGDSLRLWPSGRTEVWTSPAVRAYQTADLLERGLRRAGVETGGGPTTVEELWTGDMDAVLAQVLAADADAVALVGHNPFSEGLVRTLTGSDIQFTTGALAAIELLEGTSAFGSAIGGRLLWFVQGPATQRWKTLVSLERVLAEAADNVQRRFDAFFADPDDIETMHALRVSIRTARSLAAFVRPWQNGKQNSRIQGDLRSVVQLTSRQRELDVMWEQVSSDGSFSPELAAFCAARASKERESVLEALGSKGTRKRLERAIEGLHRIRWKSSAASMGLGADEVRERFDLMAEKLGRDMRALDLADAERTHDVRKRAKRVRYSAERFKGVLGDDAVAVAKAMVAHQDSLGAICDARTNIEIVKGFAATDLDGPVSWELALLRAKYETFLYTALRESRNADSQPEGQTDEGASLA